MNTSSFLSFRTTFLLLALAAAGALGTAFIAQYAYDKLPCELCLWQRWPYGAALVLALAGFFIQPKYSPALLGLIGVVMLGSAALAFFHIGVEQHWWKGLEKCTSAEMLVNDAAKLVAQLLEKQMAPRCDEVNWTFLGASMTLWSMLLSLALSGLAFLSLFINKRA